MWQERNEGCVRAQRMACQVFNLAVIYCWQAVNQGLGV